MISTVSADEIEENLRPVGQVVKTEASHAFNIGSNPVRVTKLFLTKRAKDNIIQDVLRQDRKTEVGAD